MLCTLCSELPISLGVKLRSLLWPGCPVRSDLWLLHALGPATSLSYLTSLWLYCSHFCSLKCQVHSGLRVCTVPCLEYSSLRYPHRSLPRSLQASAQFSMIRVAFPQYPPPILILSLPFTLICFSACHLSSPEIIMRSLAYLFVVRLPPSRL